VAAEPKQEKAVDLWPADPPTEPAMPAWPPSSSLSEAAPEPSDIPDEAIPSWPPDFDSGLGATATVEAATPSEDAGDGEGEERAQPITQKTAPPTQRVKSQPPKPQPSFEPKTVTPERESPIPAVPTPAPVMQAPAPAPAPMPAKAPAPVEPAQPAQASPPWSPAPSAPAGAQGSDVDWPDAVEVPAWAPRIHIGSTKPEPAPAAVEPPAPQPAPAASAPAPAGAQPSTPTPPGAPAARASPTASRPPPPPTGAPGAAGAKDSKSSWEVVQQQRVADPSKVVPTAEDRSYAEWFAWAKRGGAPASACHAAAQGAFQALASGKDVGVAVQWATAAMSRPPAPVSQGRQAYCAWFSLANIDMNLDQHRAHAFATGAVHALDAGADATQAHAAGLAAAGIR